jgi:hypothetical protein
MITTCVNSTVDLYASVHGKVKKKVIEILFYLITDTGNTEADDRYKQYEPPVIYT